MFIIHPVIRSLTHSQVVEILSNKDILAPFIASGIIGRDNVARKLNVRLVEAAANRMEKHYFFGLSWKIEDPALQHEITREPNTNAPELQTLFMRACDSYHLARSVVAPRQQYMYDDEKDGFKLTFLSHFDITKIKLLTNIL